jgi:hypothetical protein
VIDWKSLRVGYVYFICGFYDPKRTTPYIQTVTYSGTEQRADGGTDVVFQPAENCISEGEQEDFEPHPPIVFDAEETRLLYDAQGALAFLADFCRKK